jgi:hypothetical protein
MRSRKGIISSSHAITASPKLQTLREMHRPNRELARLLPPLTVEDVLDVSQKYFRWRGFVRVSRQASYYRSRSFRSVVAQIIERVNDVASYDSYLIIIPPAIGPTRYALL